MEIQHIIKLDQCLLQLLDPGTSPEKALQLFSTPFFRNLLPTSCLKSDSQNLQDKVVPSLIFYAYINFIKTRVSNGKVVGIWEDIMKNALRYFVDEYHVEYDIQKIKESCSSNIFAWLDFDLRKQFLPFVAKVLHSHKRCPNPYVRLEMLRFHQKLGYDLFADRRRERLRIGKNFAYTIHEISPSRFYPSGNGDDLIFGISHLEKSLDSHLNYLYISPGYYNDIRFISNILQITGVLATHYCSKNISILSCTKIIHNLYDHSKEFRKIIKALYYDEQYYSQPIREYTFETVRDITAATIFDKERRVNVSLALGVTDSLVNKLDLSPKPCDLPRLLLQRQIHGLKDVRVRQHALLLGDLSPKFKQ